MQHTRERRIEIERALRPEIGWRFIAVLAVVLIFIGGYVTAHAQLGTGIVTGTVSDSSGRALPEANVSFTNVATNEVFNTVTNGSGLFTFPPVQPGVYRVVATHGGFAQQIVNEVTVQVGGTVALNLTLKVGSTAQTITVTATAPDLNTTTAGLGIAFAQQQIENLPVNSRSALALAALTPGAHSPFAGDIEGMADRGDQVYSISVSGAPPGEAAVVIDGMNMQLFPRAETNVDPTVGALAEFKIESGTLGASYGYTAGGAINMVTRSGTNQYHGSLYEYIRNDAIDAANYFTPVGTKPPEFRYNQFGGTIGGPIMHDKMFFFVNYEGYNYLKGVPTYTSVPTLQERTGSFSDLFTTSGTPITLYDPATTAPNPSGSGQVRQPFTNNNVSSEIDPVALAYQNDFYPDPNSTPTNAYTHSNNYEAQVRTIYLMHQAMGRIDYRIAQKDNAFARYWYYENITNNPNIFSSLFWRHDDLQIQDLVVGETHVFSSQLINDLRLGGTLDLFYFTPGGTDGNWPQKLGLPSIVPDGALPSMGSGEQTPNTIQGYKGRVRLELTDTLMKTIRSHTLSFGVDYRKNADSNNYNGSLSGSYSFSASQTNNPQRPSGTGSQYASYLIGDVNSTSFNTWEGGTDRQNTIALFIQDNWKATHTLTLDLGLRYDYQQIPYDQNNHYSSWEPNVTDLVNGLQGAYEYAGVNGIGRNFMKDNYLDFNPRVGFAWSFGPRGNSVIRGGYAIYNALETGEGFAGSQAGWSNTTTYASTSPYQIFHLDAGIPSAPIAPQGSALGPAAFLGQGASYTHAYAPPPMSQVWNLAVEQVLPWGLVGQAAAVRNFGYHFPTPGYNEDTLNPQYNSLGLALQDQVPNPYYGIIPSSSSIGGATISQKQALLPYPYYLSITGNFDHQGYYIANMGEFQLTERNLKGLTVIAGYTVGKDIDLPATFNTAATANGTATLGTNPGFQNVYDLAAERSLDISDVSQRFTVSVLYQLPFGRGKQFPIQSRILDAVAGGWQINDITIVQTGFPVGVDGASNDLATRPNFVPGVSAKLSHRTPAEWFNTAAFVNPPLYTFGDVPRTLPNVRKPGTDVWNMSLFKEFPIHESMKLSFRAESFNAFNHPNFGDPSGSFSPGPNGLNASGTFATITSTSVDNRDWQFALKLEF